MKELYAKTLNSMNQTCKERFDYEVAQFDASERAKQMKEEEARRVRRNGGKALNYFLVPKCYNRKRDQSKKSDDEDYYIVPLIFGRLSKPKGSPKLRRESPDS